MAYFRAADPFPLESADDNGLHEFYARLAQGRLVTTSCGGCGRVAWPPRRFCPECVSDKVAWIELPGEGVVHGFSIQETGLPAGFVAPRVFAIVKVAGARVFAPIVGAQAVSVRVGTRVRLSPVRVTDDVKGNARYLVAFEPMEPTA
jgi:uncharacterized OB-fold protein